MPVVRMTGRVGGRKDPNRVKRGRLLYSLFEAGWDIYNGNGDQEITLGNIQEKIVESDAFVFTPGASLEDLFHASSIFVGLSTTLAVGLPLHQAPMKWPRDNPLMYSPVTG